MNRSYLLAAAFMAAAQTLHAQPLTTVTGLRLYEHHSPTIGGSQGANGIQSGYDFVTRRYYHSYNKANMGAYTGNETDSIDLVEHNGPYSTKRMFGFTSGISAIWNGDIKGNGTTKWMEAPASFNYTTATTVQQIRTAFDSTKAKQSVDTVKANTTYLGRIRGTSRYVALRTSTVKNKIPGNDDVYFDFEYKYGVLSTTGVDDLKKDSPLLLHPNPARESVTIENPGSQNLSLSIVSSSGQIVQHLVLQAGSKSSIDLRSLAQGLYFVTGRTNDGAEYTQQLIKQ